MRCSRGYKARERACALAGRPRELEEEMLGCLPVAGFVLTEGLPTSALRDTERFVVYVKTMHDAIVAGSRRALSPFSDFAFDAAAG